MAHNPYNSSRQVTISVNVKFMMGGHEVTLNVSELFTVSSDAAIQKASDWSAKNTALVYDSALNALAEKFGAMKGAPQASAEIKDEDTFTTESIVVEIKSGKPYYKIRGGRYTEFGVRVWPEVLRPHGIIEELNGKFAMLLEGYTAKVQLINGRAQKVVALEKIA